MKILGWQSFSEGRKLEGAGLRSSAQSQFVAGIVRKMRAVSGRPFFSVSPLWELRSLKTPEHSLKSKREPAIPQRSLSGKCAGARTSFLFPLLLSMRGRSRDWLGTQDSHRDAE